MTNDEITIQRRQNPGSKFRCLLVFKIVLVGAAGWFTFVIWYCDWRFEVTEQIVVACFAFSIVSLVLRLGWIVPCIVAGGLINFLIPEVGNRHDGYSPVVGRLFMGLIFGASIEATSWASNETKETAVGDVDKPLKN